MIKTNNQPAGSARSMNACSRSIGDRFATAIFLLACCAGAHAQPGTIDPDFNAAIDGQVRSVVIQPDGRIFIGGGFAAVDGILRPGVARLNTNGRLDASFNANVMGGVLSLLLEPGGGIPIATHNAFSARICHSAWPKILPLSQRLNMPNGVCASLFVLANRVASQPFSVGWRAKVHVSASSIQRDCALTIKAPAANDRKKYPNHFGRKAGRRRMQVWAQLQSF
jgi:hypothetical protein